MRLRSVLAIAGLAIAFVPHTALAANATLVDFEITNAGTVTTPCPITLKVLAHVKTAGLFYAGVTYRLDDGTTTVMTGWNVSSGTAAIPGHRSDAEIGVSTDAQRYDNDRGSR